MKHRYFFIFFTILLNFSCSNNEFEEKLIGKWYHIEAGRIPVEINFHSNELLVVEFDSMTGQWRANENVISLSLLSKINGTDSVKKVNYEYILKNDNQNLSIQLINDSNPVKATFIRATDHFDYVQKKTEIKIQLPVTKDKLKNFGFSEKDFPIFIGRKNRKIIAKTNYSEDLKNIAEELKNFKTKTRPELEDRIRFCLIADKSIDKKNIDSVRNLLKDMKVNRIYRVYKNDTINYKNDLNYYGIEL